MEGVLLIDKPQGPSSFQAVKRVRALSGVKKVGHAGTLDPLACGLLIICLGRYTKLASLLTDGEKTYEATFRLGETTATDDGEGEVLTRCSVDHLTKQRVEQALKGFIGKIQQIPPKFSAIKVGGKRAYERARTEKDFTLAARPVELFDIALIQYSLPEIIIRVRCSKGTYVRSLARDVGAVLGVGAYAKNIRRIVSGGFNVERALALTDLTEQQIRNHLMVGNAAFLGINCIGIDKTDTHHIVHGRKMISEINMLNPYALLVHNDTPVAIAKKNVNGFEIARVF